MKYLRTQHATSPWLGEGRRGASLGLWQSLKGKLVVPLSLEHLFCIKQGKIPVFGLFPALFFHVSEESSRSLPLMRGWESGKTFFYYKRLWPNLTLPREKHLILHILNHFSYLSLPSHRNRLREVFEADVSKGRWKQSDDIETPQMQIRLIKF